MDDQLLKFVLGFLNVVASAVQAVSVLGVEGQCPRIVEETFFDLRVLLQLLKDGSVHVHSFEPLHLLLPSVEQQHVVSRERPPRAPAVRNMVSEFFTPRVQLGNLSRLHEAAPELLEDILRQKFQ